MRAASSWPFFAAMALSLLAGQAQTPDSYVFPKTDRQIVAFVKSAFDFYKSSRKAGITNGSKAMRFVNGSPSLLQLGDAVSSAMLKTFDLEELAKPENADAYLTLVRISFTDRAKVTNKLDLNPSATFFVLGYLEQRETGDPALEKRIAYLKGCTANFVCSGRGEYEFVPSR